MLTPAKTKRKTREQIVSTESFPAPIGGWNARDSLAAMDKDDAVQMINQFPGTSEVLVRRGYTEQSTGLPDMVETLMSYSPGSGTQELWAISDGGIYDCTTPGAVGAAAVSALSNSRWQYINVATTGGNFLYLVNGADDPLLYDGAAWTPINGVSTPAVTGVTTNTLSNISLFKNRVWFVQKNTLKAWYLPTGAVGGAANVLDLSSVAMNGGALVAIGTWTIDAGYGVDDYIVFVTSEGEVIVYRGTDPSSAATWALTGVWKLGSPIGARCLLKYSGDLLYISRDGVVPMASAVQSSRVDPRVSLTDKIKWAVSASVTAAGSNFGWQVIDYPDANMLILNVPIGEGTGQYQYVMNTISKAWCEFRGWNANCWELYNDEIYFGADGFVGKAWSTFSDDGANIDTDCTTAFSYMKRPASLKHWRMVRTILRTNGKPNLRIGIATDFRIGNDTSPVSYTATGSSLWDTAIWDQSLWGGDLDVLPNWKGISSRPGYSAAVHFKSSSSGIDVRWVSSDLAYEFGGVVG